MGKMSNSGPDPEAVFPLDRIKSLCFIKNVVRNPGIEDLAPRGDTVIGNDVWIGYESLIMPGVKIGNGAVIAARAMVVDDVAPYTIAGGNPAMPIRKRFDDGVIELLQKIAWWDWDIEKITRNIAVLCSTDIEKLKALV